MTFSWNGWRFSVTDFVFCSLFFGCNQDSLKVGWSSSISSSRFLVWNKFPTHRRFTCLHKSCMISKGRPQKSLEREMVASFWSDNVRSWLLKKDLRWVWLLGASLEKNTSFFLKMSKLIGGRFEMRLTARRVLFYLGHLIEGTDVRVRLVSGQIIVHIRKF